MLEKMLITIEQYDCDFVECHWNLIQDEHHCYSVKKTLSYGYHNLKESISRKHFIGTHIGHTAMWNKIFKKSFLKDNNIFCPENINYEDIFFCYLVYIYATSCYSINETLYHCFYDSDSTQKKQDAKIFDKMIVAAGFLDTCRERLSNYAMLKPCIEWMFLEIYCVYMLWEVFQLFPTQSYSQYIQMKTTISSIVPDYITNPFRNDARNAFDNIMLKLIEYDLSEHDLNELRDKMLINFRHGGNVFFQTPTKVLIDFMLSFPCQNLTHLVTIYIHVHPREFAFYFVNGILFARKEFIVDFSNQVIRLIQYFNI